VRCLSEGSLRILQVLDRYLNVKVNIYIKEGGLCLCEIPVKPLSKHGETHPNMEKNTKTNLLRYFDSPFHMNVVITFW